MADHSAAQPLTPLGTITTANSVIALLLAALWSALALATLFGAAGLPVALDGGRRRKAARRLASPQTG